MDFISGDLDRVFTILYEMGKIEPLLSKDWKELYRNSQKHWSEVSVAIKKLNTLTNLPAIRNFLETLSDDVVDLLVVEVARELADFHGRNESIH